MGQFDFDLFAEDVMQHSSYGGHWLSVPRDLRYNLVFSYLDKLSSPEFFEVMFESILSTPVSEFIVKEHILKSFILTSNDVNIVSTSDDDNLMRFIRDGMCIYLNKPIQDMLDDIKKSDVE